MVMSEPTPITPDSQLYQDLMKLDSIFSELCWGPDDELIFSHDGEKVIITNKTKY